MSRLIVELQVFTTTGSYTGTWVDITKDVIFSSLGDITQKIDNDSFNAGTLTNSSISLSLSNKSGKYAPVGDPNSIFSFTRNNSLVRISWNINTYDTYCGIAVCGECLPHNDNVVIFVGLLNDDSLITDLKDQKAKFRVLGRESIFSQVTTNYSSITNGDTFEEVLYTVLNQSKITGLLTVSALNIDVGTDQEIDDKTGWENSTVKEVLDDILEASGSVLYIEDDIIYIKNRTQALTSDITFYGQASNDGLENILSLNNIRSGINKMINYWTWDDTSLISQDATSVLRNGVSKKSLSYDFITNNTKRESILDNQLLEFKNLKEEFEIEVLATQATFDAGILTGCSVDYPTVYSTISGADMPLYDVAIYDEAIYPIGAWAKIISPTIVYKIMGKKYHLKSDTITFYLREV